MDKLIIRPAGESDLNALSDLILEFHEFHAQHLPDYLNRLDKLSVSEQDELGQKILDIIRGADSTILLAEEAGCLVGFAELYLKHSEQTNRAVVSKVYAYLQSLYVSRERRGHGIGFQLLQAAEAWAYEHGAAEMRLDTWEFVAGPLAFYEKQGYHTLRRTLTKEL